MSTSIRVLKASTGLALVTIFVLALVALFGGNSPATRTQDSALPTPTPPQSPLPTDEEAWRGTPMPTSTVPPFPTPLPTPIVTPIPTAVPPFIPEVVGTIQQPFWIIYWQDNEIWRIDDRGNERQMLLDTYESLGLYLTANP